MSAHDILEWSVGFERALFFVSLVLVPVVFLTVLRSREKALLSESNSLIRSPSIALAIILFVAAILRFVGYDSLFTSPWWFSQIETYDLGQLSTRSDFWTHFWAGFSNFHHEFVSDSPPLMLAGSFFYSLLGATTAFPVIVGGIFGLAFILAAFALGRLTHPSSMFAFFFAATLAVSPLEVTWSRLSGVGYLGAVHFVGGLCLAYLASARRSFWYGVIAGLFAWSSLYYYYAVRALIPLAFLAIFAGVLKATPTGTKRTSRYSLIYPIAGCIAPILLLYAVLATTNPFRTFWPFFPGYVGNSGEATWWQLVTSGSATLAREFPRFVRGYFLFFRSEDPWNTAPVFKWGMAHGGLCFLPASAFALIGLLSSFRNWRANFLYYALLVIGALLPSLSFFAARRVLLFDFSWCAFTALGLTWTFRKLHPRYLSLGLAKVLAVTVFISQALWTFLVIYSLNASLPPNVAHIPFGQGWFGDGLTCRGCAEQGDKWEEDLADGNAIVYFDTDRKQEDPTCPAGLPLYGHLAAARANRPDSFVEFYPTLKNLQWRYPNPPLRPPDVSFDEYFLNTLAGQQVTSVLWYFVAPTQWERALIERSQGSVSELPGIRGGSVQIVVKTPWPLAAEIQDYLQELGRNGRARGEACLQLKELASEADIAPVEHTAVAGRNVKTGCLSKRGDNWWAVDSISGALFSNADVSWIPKSRWIGVALDDRGRLVLASANDGIQIYDTHAKRQLGSFYATLYPSLNRTFGECAGLAAGNGWIATLNSLSAILTLHTEAGEEIASLDLARYFGLNRPEPISIAGTGNYLTIRLGADRSIRKLDLRISSDLKSCREAPVESVQAVYEKKGAPLSLSGLNPTYTSQAWGTPQVDKTVSGEILRVGGKTYNSGFGVHANSLLRFELAGRYSSFTSDVGLPDQITSAHPGSVVFRVKGDGKVLWESEIVRSASGARHAEVDVKGISMLELVVDDTGDGMSYDHALWLEPALR